MIEPDPLAGLRDQIRAATEAAERLLQDARREASAAPRPRPRPEASAATGPTPPAGWQQTAEARAPGEVATLLRLLEQLGEVLPAELQQQLIDLVRQILVVVRTLIDWAVTRLEQDGPGRAVEVEDIPIG